MSPVWFGNRGMVDTVWQAGYIWEGGGRVQGREGHRVQKWGLGEGEEEVGGAGNVEEVEGNATSVEAYIQTPSLCQQS